MRARQHSLVRTGEAYGRSANAKDLVAIYVRFINPQVWPYGADPAGGLKNESLWRSSLEGVVEMNGQ
jgi:hypothetical protein